MAAVLQEKIRVVRNCRRKNLATLGKKTSYTGLSRQRQSCKAPQELPCEPAPARASPGHRACGELRAEPTQRAAPGETAAGRVARAGLPGGKGRLIPGSPAVPTPARWLRLCLPSPGSRRSRPAALPAGAGPSSPAGPTELRAGAAALPARRTHGAPRPPAGSAGTSCPAPAAG